MITSAHQTIQTKMMLKLRLPTGVPKKAVRMASKKKPRVISTRVNCSGRQRRMRLSSGMLVRSKRQLESGRVVGGWDMGMGNGEWVMGNC